MSEQVIEEVQEDTRRKVYRAGTDANPGRYYFADDRRIVPRQVLKGGIPNPEFSLDKYQLVPKPAPKAISRGPKADYSRIRESEPTVCKRVNVEDINMLATKQGWKLSARALKAMQVWGKGLSELSDILAKYKEDFTDCNYIDYNLTDNHFVVKWRSISEPSTPLAVDSPDVSDHE